MPKYIDADEIKKTLLFEYDNEHEYYIDDIIAYIPTADVAPVVHGRWGIKHENHFSYYVCSNCGFNGLVCKKYNTYNYCPYCGAKMRGEDNNDK